MYSPCACNTFFSSSAIERVWGFAKRFTRDNCGYSLIALRKLVPQGLASISIYLARRFYLKSIRYLDIYEAVQCSAPLADLICRTYRSHRRVCDNTIEGAIRKAAEAAPLQRDALLALLNSMPVVQQPAVLGGSAAGNGEVEDEDDDEDEVVDVDNARGDSDEWEDLE